jgi:hypothetical protein
MMCVCLECSTSWVCVPVLKRVHQDFEQESVRLSANGHVLARGSHTVLTGGKKVPLSPICFFAPEESRAA